MAFKFVRGQSILETVGPSCHLVGWLQRDTQYPNRLVLTRNSDALSPQLRAVRGRWLPTLRVTDPTGKSATMSIVTFIDTKPIQSQVAPASEPPSAHSQHDTDSLEEISFTFQNISVENLTGSTSSSDEVFGWPPSRHHRRDTDAIGTVSP